LPEWIATFVADVDWRFELLRIELSELLLLILTCVLWRPVCRLSQLVRRDRSLTSGHWVVIIFSGGSLFWIRRQPLSYARPELI